MRDLFFFFFARVVSNNLVATAGEDYVAVDEEITFLPNDTQKPLFVTIRPDVKVEADETFVLLLSTDADWVVVGDRVMTVTITDDDGKNDFDLNILLRFKVSAV